jgi:hypothetical protein
MGFIFCKRPVDHCELKALRDSLKSIGVSACFKKSAIQSEAEDSGDSITSGQSSIESFFSDSLIAKATVKKEVISFSVFSSIYNL